MITRYYIIFPNMCYYSAMTRIMTLFVIMLISVPVLAKADRDYQSTRTKLLADLKAAKTEAQGQAAEDAIRRFWFKGPTNEITSKLNMAIRARRFYNFEKAVKIINSIIAANPEYFEAYNQRAFVYFLQEKYDKALEDVALTLGRGPKHFAAMAGKAIIFLRQGRLELARRALLRAVEIHPWLRERLFLNSLPKR